MAIFIIYRNFFLKSGYEDHIRFLIKLGARVKYNPSSRRVKVSFLPHQRKIIEGWIIKMKEN